MDNPNNILAPTTRILAYHGAKATLTNVTIVIIKCTGN